MVEIVRTGKKMGYRIIFPEMKGTLLWFCLLTGLILMTAAGAGAAIALPGAKGRLGGKSVDIEAGYLYYDKRTALYHAQGGVVIHQGEMELKADKAVLNQRLNQFEAWGHVLLRDGSDYLACRYLRFNYVTRIGSIRDGRIFIKEKNYYITGERIEKLGPGEYEVEKASLTTCDAERAAWLIRCNKVHIKKGGYGVVKDAVFAVKDVPVIYLPKGVFPVNTRRQTGFLLPGIGYSDDEGLITKNAFFWAINRSSDLTLYPQTYAKRGIRFGAKYRYVLNERAKGDIMGSFISDKLVDDHPEDYPDADRKRWSFGFHHFQNLKNGCTTLKADVNLVSDNEFLDDFPDTFSGAFIDELDNLDAKSDSYLRSLATATHKWELQQTTLTIDSRYYQTLIHEDNDEVLQLLPEVTLALLNRPLGGSQWLLGRVDATYDHFWRKEGEKGHRLDFHPTLSLPFRFGPLEVMPFLELRETVYRTDSPDSGVDGNSHREILTAGIDLKGVAERVYIFDWWGMDRVLHTLESHFAYRYVPDVDQDDLPVYDWLDYRPEESNISYYLVSRLIGRFPRRAPARINGGSAAGSQPGYDYHEWLKFQIGQSYNFIDVPDGWRFTRPNRHASDWFSQLELKSRGGGLYVKLENRFNPYISGNDLMTALVKARDRRGDFLSLEYRYERDLAEVFTGSGRVPVLSWLDFYSSLRYSFRASEYWETLYGFNLHPQCWALDFAVDKEYNPDDLTFRVLVTLNGLGSIGKQ